MSADHDGDSQMMSSPDDSDSQSPSAPAPRSSTTAAAASSILSPPESQHLPRTTMPTSAPDANENGKRPLNTISNGADDNDNDEYHSKIANASADLAGSSLATPNPTTPTEGKPRAEFPTQTHERSGYKWNREEDAPGHAWLNKKALDEYHRAWDALVHRESMVRARYGDPFELAEREHALRNSLTQK